MDDDFKREIGRARLVSVKFLRLYLLIRKLLKKPLIPLAIGLFLGCIITCPIENEIGWAFLGSVIAYSVFFVASQSRKPRGHE